MRASSFSCQLRMPLDQGFLFLLQGSVLKLHLLEMSRLEMLRVGSIGVVLLLQGGAQLLLLSLAGRLELLLLRLEKSQLLLEPLVRLAQGVPLRDGLAQPDLKIGNLAVSRLVLSPQRVVRVHLGVIKLLRAKQRRSKIRFGPVNS